jgi:hypothetical protein
MDSTASTVEVYIVIPAIVWTMLGQFSFSFKMCSAAAAIYNRMVIGPTYVWIMIVKFFVCFELRSATIARVHSFSEKAYVRVMVIFVFIV